MFMCVFVHFKVFIDVSFGLAICRLVIGAIVPFYSMKSCGFITNIYLLFNVFFLLLSFVTAAAAAALAVTAFNEPVCFTLTRIFLYQTIFIPFFSVVT